MASGRHPARLARPRRISALNLILMFLALVLSTGMIAGLASADGEYFPFASYSLFSIVPNVRTEYAVRIHVYHGRQLDPPLLLQQAGGLGIDASSIEIFYLIQRIGRAYDNGQTDEADYWRRLLERDFLHPPLDYVLLTLRYDPLERWNTGRFRDMRLLKEFSAEPVT